MTVSGEMQGERSPDGVAAKLAAIVSEAAVLNPLIWALVQFAGARLLRTTKQI